MDQQGGFGAGDEAATVEDEPAPDERPAGIGGDERRMHVRAYNFWVSLLDGRAYPSIDDFDPAHAGDFSEHGVLLDFSRGETDPAITHLGGLLRRECGIAGDIGTLADVPSRTLLSRLTDHYLQIIANRAPIGFEAEFVDQRGHSMLYRGILMPFSSDGERIDHVYGVINWKTLADAADLAGVTVAAPAAAAAPGAAPWADGPGAALDGISADEALALLLAAARDGAARAAVAWIDSRASLQRALALAYDLLVTADDAPHTFAAMLAEAGIRDRSAVRAAVRLVFGPETSAAHLAELTDALAHARRLQLPAGGLGRHLEGRRGGTRALIAAERAIRAKRALARARRRLGTAPGRTTLPAIAPDAFALLLARQGGNGQAEIVAALDDGSPLVDEAIRELAR